MPTCVEAAAATGPAGAAVPGDGALFTGYSGVDGVGLGDGVLGVVEGKGE